MGCRSSAVDGGPARRPSACPNARRHTREDGRLWIAALCVAGLELADGFPVTSFSQVDITQRLMGQWIIDVKFECALDFYHCRILLSGEREEFGQRTSEPGSRC